MAAYANGAVNGTSDSVRHGQSALARCQDEIASQREYMVALHSEWYLQTLYCEGLLNVNYDTNSGREVFYGSGSPHWTQGYNLLDSTINHMLSALMASSPKREVRSIQPTEMALQEARLGKLVLDWAYEFHKIEEKERLAADDFVKQGNSVIFFEFDPTRGEVIGQHNGRDVRTGMLCLRVDSPMRWFFDPRASTFDEVRYAIRRTVQPIEYVEERFPHMRGQLEQMQTSIHDDDLLELRMLNLTQSRRGTTPSLPRGKRLVTVFERFENPCPEYPEGGHQVFVGSGSVPIKLVHDYGKNTFGCIPCELLVCSRVNGRLFGKTPIKFLIPANQTINARRRQIHRNAAICGNPILAYPTSGGTPPGMVSNVTGQMLPFDAASGGAPFYLAPPQMSPFIMESERGDLNLMAVMAPVSPFDRDQAEKTTSGIQLSLMEEIKRRAILPMVRSWEIGWDSVWKKYLKLWRRFTVFPTQLEAVGPEAIAISGLVSGDMISDNVVVRVVPASSMPPSRTAAFAEWVELFKTGAANPGDPMTMKRFWEDIGKGDMARTYRDQTDDMDLGARSLMRVIRGEMVLPRMQDNPDVIIDKIVHYMRSPEYEDGLTRDPMLEKRLTDTLTMFGIAKQQQELAQIQAAARMQALAAMAGQQATGWFGGGPGQQGAATQGQAKQIAPGNPMGGNEPQSSRGFGNAPNTMKDQGGGGDR